MNDPTRGSHGKLHRTTKILSHAYRRRGGRVAAHGAGAAADAGIPDAAHHRYRSISSRGEFRHCSAVPCGAFFVGLRATGDRRQSAGGRRWHGRRKGSRERNAGRPYAPVYSADAAGDSSANLQKPWLRSVQKLRSDSNDLQHSANVGRESSRSRGVDGATGELHESQSGKDQLRITRIWDTASPAWRNV